MGIVSFFEGVFNNLFAFFESIISFIKMVIDGVTTLLWLVPQGISYLSSAILLAPFPLIPFMLLTVTVSAILFIIGRMVD